MSANTKIAVAVAGGYLLGRTKKLRLAVTLAGMLAGKRLAAHREDLMSQGTKLLGDNPQLKELQGQLTGRLVDVARDAAMAAATSRIESVTRSLQPRGADEEPVDEPDEEPVEEPDEEPIDEEEAEEQPEEEEPEPELEEEPEKPPAKTTSRKSTAKKSTKKTAKKSTAKKSTAKRAPAKSGR